LQIILSQRSKSAGSTKITISILMMAPRAISIHMELIMSISNKWQRRKLLQTIPYRTQLLTELMWQVLFVLMLFCHFPQYVPTCILWSSNRIVHCGAQLDGADTDRRDKRQTLTEIMRQPEIDEYCKFNYGNQNKRQGNAP